MLQLQQKELVLEENFVMIFHFYSIYVQSQVGQDFITQHMIIVYLGFLLDTVWHAKDHRLDVPNVILIT